MSDEDICHGKHWAFLMHINLVFVYRREAFAEAILDQLRSIFTGVCIEFEAELVEFSGEDDDVHLLVNYSPEVPVSALAHRLKGASSRTIRQKNDPSIRQKMWARALCLHSSLAGSCSGAPIAVMRQYIEQQQTLH